MPLLLSTTQLAPASAKSESINLTYTISPTLVIP